MPNVRRERFELALDLLRPSEWEAFEQIASEFLASEFGALRTMASASGDQGRDAMLFAQEGSQATAFQYSVAEDWRGKIRRTLKRLNEAFPGETKVLVYVSNRVIGADADDLRKELAAAHIYLDIRDRTWFLERVNSGSARQAAAERLIDRVVEPFLASKQLIQGKAQALEGSELRVAAVYLGLQWEDDTREKGLTKLCFEAIVRSVLQGTTPDARMTRSDIRAAVRTIVSTHPATAVDTHTDSALDRMAKRSIRHYSKDDSFCLTIDERQRLGARLADLEQADRAFQNELSAVVRTKAEQAQLPAAAISEVTDRTRSLLERVLLTLGEAFANAVRTGEMRLLGLDGIRDLILHDATEHAPTTVEAPAFVAVVSESIIQLVTEAGPASHAYQRRLADSYTLLAFLREMPDVQAAMVKMFSDGEIWLDTSLILPLMAEELIDDEENRRFTAMLKAASDTGLRLRMTQGVLEEIDRHLNNSVACLRSGSEWRSRTPFLFAAYVSSGRGSSAFAGWLEQFAGHDRPFDDIAEYLRDVHSISVGSLEEPFKSLRPELRHALEEIWNEIHEGRRGQSHDVDAITLQRLAQHDVENYGGALAKRHQERDSPFGYSTWWLTLDRSAFDVRVLLGRRLGERPPDSPVMSADFLLNYLTFGPVRARLGKGVETRLPVVADLGATELPRELLEIAEQIRGQSDSQNERLIRRRVRDELDRAKMRRGIVAAGGGDAMQRDVQARIRDGASRSSPSQ